MSIKKNVSILECIKHVFEKYILEMVSDISLSCSLMWSIVFLFSYFFLNVCINLTKKYIGLNYFLHKITRKAFLYKSLFLSLKKSITKLICRRISSISLLNLYEIIKTNSTNFYFLLSGPKCYIFITIKIHKKYDKRNIFRILL